MAFDFTIEVTGKKSDNTNYSIDADLNGEQTLLSFFKLTKEVLISTFVTVLKEEQSRGFTKQPIFKVDNNFNKRIENVKPFGKLQAFSRVNVFKITDFIYESLVSRSRVKTGNYVSSHVMFFNGRPVASNFTEYERWKEANRNRSFKKGDVIKFINLAPYARKLELYGRSSQLIGVNSKKINKVRRGKNAKGKDVRKPNGAYWRTYTQTSRKFQKIGGRLRFTFTPLFKEPKAFNAGRTGPSGKQFRTTFKSDGRPYVYPTITFRVDDRSAE